MKKTRYAKGNGSALKSILLGALLIWILFFVISLVCTFILYSGNDPTPKATLFSLASFMLAGAIGSLMNKRIFHPSLSNAPFLSALLCAIVFIFLSTVANGRLPIGTLISAVCFMLISAIASVPKRKKQK